MALPWKEDQAEHRESGFAGSLVCLAGRAEPSGSALRQA
jgi:hypothetical protein